MSDRGVRAAERGAATGDVHERAKWLRGRVRAGSLESSRLKVAAYAGDLSARYALGGEYACPNGHDGLDQVAYLRGVCVDCMDLADWARTLSAIGAPVLVTEPCEPCKGTGGRGPRLWASLGGEGASPVDCSDCEGSGTVTRDVGPRYWPVVACLGAARLVLPGWIQNHLAETHGWTMANGDVDIEAPGPCCDRPAQAIEAADRWVASPTRDNEPKTRNLCGGDWGDVVEGFGSLWPLIWNQHGEHGAILSEALRLFSTYLKDESAVRAAACSALIRSALGEAV